MPDVVGQVSTVGQGLAALEGMVTQQAAIMAYSNAFLIMTFVSLCAFPLLALIRVDKVCRAGSREDGGACGDGLSERIRAVGARGERAPLT